MAGLFPARAAAHRARAWFGVLCVLLCPLSAAAQSDSLPELRSIRFEGARAFPEALLRAAIISTPSGCGNPIFELIQACRLGIGRTEQPVDSLALQSDVFRLRLLYYERGYRDVQVTVNTRTDGRVQHATFRITEGEPVRVDSIELGGLEELDSLSERVLARVRTQLPLRQGAPLDMVAYEAARDTLLYRLQNVGYANAEVFARYRIPQGGLRSAQVGFDIVPGQRVYFGTPTIQGNEKVSPRVIRRVLDFRAGDLYSRASILNSQRNLFGLDVFRNIDIRTDLDAAGDTIVPLVIVQEGNLNRFRFGGGISTAEYVNVEGRWTARNFMGGARRLEVRARVANLLASSLEAIRPFESTRAPYDQLNGSLGLDFTRPWFLDLENSIGAGVYVERRSIPDVFVRSALGGYVAVTRVLGRNTTTSVAYRPELTELDAEDEIFCITFVACDAGEIRLLREPHWLAPVTFSFARDRSNSLFSPTGGYTLRVEGEYASAATGSEFAYTRLALEWTTYVEVLRGLVLASRVRPGWAHSINQPGTGLGLHPQKRFFAGGASSVRGFGQYKLGPQLLKIDAAANLLASDSVSGFQACTAQRVNAGTCDVSLLARGDPGRFDTRPVGGAAALEASVEARFPLFGQKLQGALFTDLGQVWSAEDRVRPSELVWTPGFGLRYFSPIGPIRIDLGYNTQGAQQLQVLTTKVCDLEAPVCTADSIMDGIVYPPERLANTRVLTSLGRVPWGENLRFRDRLQLHFSIGQAF